MMRLTAALLVLLAGAAVAREPQGLHEALDKLAADGRFSGAVVIRDEQGVRFARGYGMADPFTNRPFTPDTPVDSGSLAKPVTAAAILLLARDGTIDFNGAAVAYLPEIGHPDITIRQLLSHSAGLQVDESAEALAGKSNLDLVRASAAKPLLFKPGTGFTYCNACTVALAAILERSTETPYLTFAQSRLGLPTGVTLRPARLAHWQGRAIGYRRSASGTFERADSYEGEAFYGAANLSISASQLADWGLRWWQAPLADIRQAATAPAQIGSNFSGLSLGNWYCAQSRRQCHYLGHHEGFHHMLYWDAERRVSIAMVSNNSMDPALHQRLQRALVASVEAYSFAAAYELAAAAPEFPPTPGRYRLDSGETVEVRTPGNRMIVRRGGIDYPAYPVSENIRYVPGLDLYLAGAAGRRLHWLTLYEDYRGTR